MHLVMQQVGDLLNPKANHKLHTTAHSIETLHMYLDVCELNKDFIKGLHAGFANRCEKTLGFDQINPLYIKNEACIHFLLY